ncbi:DNA polymerase III subunit delta [bacterium]|nr:DNA polymerase III subunit delta [bacterium]
MIYFFYGDEEFNIDQEISKLKKGLDKNFLEMSFKTYDNPKFADLVAILRTQPMMFGKMLVIIKSNDYFSKTFDDKELKQIEEALEDNNANLDIVFLAELPRNEGKKLDSRKKFFKLLAKYNAKEFPSIPAYKTAELEAWIKKQAKTKDIDLEPEAVSAMITQVGNNLREIDGELEKLKLFVYPNKKITKEIVNEFCISNEDLFAFSDHLMKGEKDKALLEYRKLLEKKFCLEIVAALQTMVRKWITLKAKSSECTTFELSKLTGQHEYVVKLSLQKLKNTSLKDLVKLKQNLTEAEYKIKSGQSLMPEREVEDVLFR